MRRMYLQMVGNPPQGAGMDTAVATRGYFAAYGEDENEH